MHQVVEPAAKGRQRRAGSEGPAARALLSKREQAQRPQPAPPRLRPPTGRTEVDVTSLSMSA
jgi:hypothetical protein